MKRLLKRAIDKDLLKEEKLDLIKEMDEILNNLIITVQFDDFLSVLDLIQFIVKEVTVDADH